MLNFLIRRLRSIGYAFKGMVLLIKTEASIQTQVVIGILVTILGFWLHISVTEWCLQFLAIGLVIGLEGVNTAVEKMADYIHPEHDEKIGFIKDISAGAVFVAAVMAMIVGLIIYIPKLF